MSRHKVTSAPKTFCSAATSRKGWMGVPLRWADPLARSARSARMACRMYFAIDSGAGVLQHVHLGIPVMCLARRALHRHGAAEAGDD